jgi:hypothetical protein
VRAGGKELIPPGNRWKLSFKHGFEFFGYHLKLVAEQKIKNCVDRIDRLSEQDPVMFGFGRMLCFA